MLKLACLRILTSLSIGLLEAAGIWGKKKDKEFNELTIGEKRSSIDIVKPSICI
ncbi:MAG: hypothetical protein QW341_05340 [Candidatus Bathyarchaeia archaeon]